jgi:plastocyanin
VTIRVRDNFYDPASVTVSAGSTVTWMWASAGSHSVTFEDNQGSSAIQNSGEIDRTFNVPGTFRFRCQVHSSNFTAGMIGSVVVQ